MSLLVRFEAAYSQKNQLDTTSPALHLEIYILPTSLRVRIYMVPPPSSGYEFTWHPPPLSFSSTLLPDNYWTKHFSPGNFQGRVEDYGSPLRRSPGTTLRRTIPNMAESTFTKKPEQLKKRKKEKKHNNELRSSFRSSLRQQFFLCGIGIV